MTNEEIRKLPVTRTIELCNGVALKIAESGLFIKAYFDYNGEMYTKTIPKDHTEFGKTAEDLLVNRANKTIQYLEESNKENG